MQIAASKMEVRQQMVEWLSAFLWHLEDSALLAGEAAEAIVTVIEKQFEAGARNQSHHLPEPLAFLRELENHERQTQSSR